MTHLTTTKAILKPAPIRVGDKFKMNGQVLEVTEIKPGGKLELMNRERAHFHYRYHREVRQWERAE